MERILMLQQMDMSQSQAEMEELQSSTIAQISSDQELASSWIAN